MIRPSAPKAKKTRPFLAVQATSRKVVELNPDPKSTKNTINSSPAAGVIAD